MSCVSIRSSHAPQSRLGPSPDPGDEGGFPKTFFWRGGGNDGGGGGERGGTGGGGGGGGAGGSEKAQYSSWLVTDSIREGQGAVCVRVSVSE